jgi:N-acetylmuramoyl-L-alanine amidase
MTLPDLIARPSPNHDARPTGQPVDILLLHYTGMQSAEAALERLCDPAARVSSHYLIDENGACYRLVPEARRAWHAGVSAWAGSSEVNARSIGIELVNPGHEFGYRPFPAPQMAALQALCLGILSRHPIPAHRVLGHSDVAPLRKQDPGELFDWAGLARAGIGLWPAPDAARAPDLASLGLGMTGEAVRALQSALAAYGYGIEPGGRFDSTTAAVVTAFQRHFRQARVDGIADGETQSVLAHLLAKAMRPGSP